MPHPRQKHRQSDTRRMIARYLCGITKDVGQSWADFLRGYLEAVSDAGTITIPEYDQALRYIDVNQDIVKSDDTVWWWRPESFMCSRCMETGCCDACFDCITHCECDHDNEFIRE